MLDEILAGRYFAEFMAMAIAHAVAVISPGPDFAVVSRYSVRHGARLALWVSAGIGTGILIHVTYSILGLALIINQTPWLYQLLLLIASAYFFWLGWNAIRSGPEPAAAPIATTDKVTVNQIRSENSGAAADSVSQVSNGRAFLVGFLTNGLNIKATMFFLALFTSIISVQTPISVKIGFGVYLAIATFIWFATLSLMIGKTRIRSVLLSHGYWFDRLMGGVLWLLASHLLWQWFQHP
ncbi:lysine transporter LysE [Aliidiomarina iranensis]|uniref:Lysine transporter LysE n=1 Tax=Aliidiomarina iranensis TaxID=1434071 RepID=A0A432W068_9GAMM|nr:LysE family translocator [Aliidiomarina iranensis]RUO22419.1 lysine transporter LysE [Aliidiomarina iranensis]